MNLSQTLSPINLKPQAESSINRSFNKTFVVPLNYNMNISSAKDLPKEKKRPKAKGKSKLEGIKERKKVTNKKKAQNNNSIEPDW